MSHLVDEFNLKLASCYSLQTLLQFYVSLSEQEDEDALQKECYETFGSPFQVHAEHLQSDVPV